MSSYEVVDGWALQMEALGAAETSAAIDEVTASTEGLNAATLQSAAAMDASAAASARATQRGFLLNQMLYSARRYAFYGTTALLAIGAGAVFAGFKFDAMMQSSTLAFTGLLHSSAAARTELAFLFNMAAHSPFLFTNLTTGARQLLAFGYTIQDANRILTASANALAYLGHPENLSRLTYVFGEIHQSGFLMMRQMRQLYTAGVPVFPALRKELHLTQTQIEEFMRGKLRIPSDLGINAIIQYMQTRFGDGMARFSKTWTGRWTTFKDYAQMMMGRLVSGPFNALLGGLGHINDAMEKLIKSFNTGGTQGFLNTLDSMVGAGGFLAGAFNEIGTVGKILGNVFSNIIIPALQRSAMLVLFLVATFRPMLWALDMLTGHGQLLSWVLTALIARWILLQYWMVVTKIATLAYWAVVDAGTLVMISYRAALWAAAFAQAFFTGATEEGGIAMQVFTVQQAIMAARYWLITAATWAATAAGAAWEVIVGAFPEIMIIAAGAATLFSGAIDILTASFAALDVAFWVSPAGLILLAIMGVIAGIVLMILYWNKVKTAIVSVATFAVNHWKDVVAFLVGGPIGWALYHFWDPIKSGLTEAVQFVEHMFVSMWNKVIGWIKAALNWIIGEINFVINAYNNVVGAIPFFGGDLKVGTIGYIGGAASTHPTARRVTPAATPNRQIWSAAGGKFSAAIHAHIPVQISGDTVAEHNAHILLSEGARA